MKRAPLLCSNVPTHQLPAGAQAAYLKQGIVPLKLLEFAELFQRCNKGDADTTLCINLDFLIRGLPNQAACGFPCTT